MCPSRFANAGWTRNFSKCPVSCDGVWEYLDSHTSTVRQAHRGWALHDEGYVANQMLNTTTADPEVGLLRGTFKPSMKTGSVYEVTAWYEKTTGDIIGAYCQCSQATMFGYI
ncbi:hypothetical protein HPB52_015011 [Rhipicephalus sanguineus]|uniref:Uncharacterized protein n=1 Tax=Rhipicephalus sanguineus TaxID=34632 RepID=A0A9D4Q6U5_RHISA|nr:hypothetical protein HPB52_015011 [Rhipicephalus sanguineus]